MKTLVPAALLCLVTATCLLMSIVPWVTGGRLGIIAVEGDSMREIACGARVIALPLPVRPGDFVTAWGCVDDGECSSDLRPALLVKLYTGSHLRSTACDQTCSQFQLRGRVVAVLPLQKVVPALGRGSCTRPAACIKPRTPEQQAEVMRRALWQQHERRQFYLSADERWQRLDGACLTGTQTQRKVVRLPEPVDRIGIIGDCCPGGAVEIYAGRTLIQTLRTLETWGPRTVAAPPGQQIDRLVLTNTGSDFPGDRVTLCAVRPLDTQVAAATATAHVSAPSAGQD